MEEKGTAIVHKAIGNEPTWSGPDATEHGESADISSLLWPFELTNNRLAKVARYYSSLAGGTASVKFSEEPAEFSNVLANLEMSADTLSKIAATLANNGVCPLTGETVLSAANVRDTLSKMSASVEGAFYFDIGLPAKSGVGGGIMVVVPGVMGLCTFSPRLDRFNNSVRGTIFCRGLSKRFNFHPYAYDMDTDILSMKKTGKQ